MSRNSPCFCGSGKKTKKCHATINSGSKLADICRANREFDQDVQLHGKGAKCPAGCSACCNDFFFVSENEFLLILDRLQREGGNDLINTYRQKAKDYEVYVKEYFPGILEKLDTFMPATKNQLDKSFFNDDFLWVRSKSCIFLKEGRCSIYEDRPVVCRKYGVSVLCEVIDNDVYSSDKDVALDESAIIRGDNSLHIKRPYPLFYYFSALLEPPYYERTMRKLTMIRTKSEKEYATYTKQISQG